jgi:hypothetical protein
MTKLLTRPLTQADLTPAFEAFPETISLEEEFSSFGDATENKKQLDFTLADAETLLNIKSALEDLEFVTASMQQPTAREAALVQLVADSAACSLGISGETVVPALEADATGAGTAEKIKAFIDKIVKAILEAGKFLYEKLKEFLTNIGKTLGNAKARYEVAYRAYSNMDANARGGKVSIRRVSVNQHVMDSPAQFIVTAKNFVSTMHTFVAEITDFEDRFRNTMGEFYMKVIKNELQGDKLLVAIRPLMELARQPARTCKHASTEEEVKHVNEDRAGFHVKMTQSDDLMGGIVIKRGLCQEIGDFKDSFEMVPRVISILSKDARFTVTPVDDNPAETHPYMSVDALDKNGCKQVLSLADDLLKSINSKAPGTLGGAIAALAKKADGAVKTFGAELRNYEGTQTNRRAYAGALEDVTTHLLHQSSSPLTSMLMTSLRNFNLCLEYVNQSAHAAKA